MKRRVAVAGMIVSLLGGLVFPILFALGRMAEPTYKAGLLAATAVYFVFAVLWATNRKKG